MNAIEARSLGKDYAAVRAVDAIDLGQSPQVDVRPGSRGPAVDGRRPRCPRQRGDQLNAGAAGDQPPAAPPKPGETKHTASRPAESRDSTLVERPP